MSPTGPSPAVAAPAAGTSPAGTPAPASLLPQVPSWSTAAAGRAAVYFVPGTVPEGAAREAAARLDRLLGALAQDSGLEPAGVVVFPLYPSVERFAQEWWRFADLGREASHGWGTVYAGGPVEVSPYQVARLLARQAVGPDVPLLAWGLGDLIADRLTGADSHAHARLFLDRQGLPPIHEIVHQMDFSRALPGAYAQSVSFLAYLAEEHGLREVVALAMTGGRRWYTFADAFEERFGMPLSQADRLWRERLEKVAAPPISDADFTSYSRALEFAYAFTLARSPGGLLLRPGGAAAFVEGIRATDAVRRFDLRAAAEAADRGRTVLERAQSSAARTRLAAQAGVWAIALVPILLVVLILAGPAIRSALGDLLRRRSRAARFRVRGGSDGQAGRQR